MSTSSSHTDWDDDHEDEDAISSHSSENNLTRKQRLDVRRKLEDRMEMKRLRQEIGDLDDLWLD